jgi:hypothetical protein
MLLLQLVSPFVACIVMLGVGACVFGVCAGAADAMPMLIGS